MSPIRPIGLSSLETRMEVLSQDCLKLLDPCTTAHILKCFFHNFYGSLEYKSVPYTMVYAPCFEEVYLNIRNQSGCFCETSFLKAGLYCTRIFGTLWVQKYGNDGLKHGCKDVLWPMSRVTKRRFSP